MHGLIFSISEEQSLLPRENEIVPLPPKLQRLSSHKGETFIRKENAHGWLWEKSSLHFWSLSDVASIVLICHRTRSGESFESKLFVKQLNSCFQLELSASRSCFKGGQICESRAALPNPESPCATFTLSPLSLFSLSLFIFNLLVKLNSDLKKAIKETDDHCTFSPLFGFSYNLKRFQAVGFFHLNILHLRLDHFLGGYIRQVSNQKILINRIALHWLLSIHI